LFKPYKKLSLLLIFTLAATMFTGLGTVSAAGITYSSLDMPVYRTGPEPQTEDATVLIEVKDAIFLGGDLQIASVSLPTGTEFALPGSAVKLEVFGTDPGFAEVKAIIKSSRTADLYIDARNGPFAGEVRFILTFSGLVVRSGAGDLMVEFTAPSGSAFNFASLDIANVDATDNINVQAGTIKKIGDAGGYIDTITISENYPGILKEGDTIAFKLPAGFSWGDSDYIVAEGGWAFDGYHGMGTGGDFSFTVNGRDLILTINELPDSVSSAGKIMIGTESLSSTYPLGGYAFIEVDDGTAPGNIILKVKASDPDITINDLTAASFDEYGITLETTAVTEVIAGRTDQKLGEFVIKEAVRNSLKKGQTIYFDLPEGVKWVDYGTIEIDGTAVINEDDYTAVTGSEGRKIKNTLTANSEEVTQLTFKDMKVSIEPWFSGPLEIVVSGTVDVGGRVTVAEVIQPVVISVEGMTNVVFGAMNQKAGDIIITESESGTIMSKAGNDQIFITLPEGVSFAGTPHAEVITGDLDLGEVKIGSTGVATVDDGLLIKITADSSQKSVIKISDVYLTLDRTVPEGVVKAKLEGIKDFGWAQGSTALLDFNTSESMGSADIARTITPLVSGTASFIIGSSTYQVGGISHIMDVTPYIKDDRSFVPVRYLGENMLGATVDWNEGEQKVVLTRGGIELVLTIGSKTYTVNGVERTADVAPEIVNSRTFLPARYVAEAFGASVGWDAATYTVTIQR